MNEEEKQAIEYLKARLYGNEGCYLIDVAQSDLRIFLNLVENQQKDIKNWEKICDEQEDDITLKDNKICDLEFEIKKQQKEIEDNRKYIDLHYVPYEQYTCNLNELNKKWKDKIRELKEKVEKEMISNPYDFSYMINELLGE